MPFSARVLVVSGDSTSRMRLTAMLDARGYQCHAAANADVAEHVISSQEPDLAIIEPDQQTLSPGTVQDLAEAMKRSHSAVKYPVILVGDDSDETAAIETRFAQPFHDMQLVSRIESLVRLDTMAQEFERRLLTAADFGLERLPNLEDLLDVDDVKILVVGEADTDYSQMQSVLNKKKTSIVGAFTTSMAVDYLNQSHFDVVILNVTDNISDLLSVGEHMRRNPRLFNIPIIVLADLRRLSSPEEVYRDGATDILAKPVREQELERRTNVLVRESRCRKTLRDFYANGHQSITHDSLTGLYTYGFLRAHIDRVVADAVKHNRGFTTAYFEIKNMSAINEQYGYAVGDRVLAQIGSIFGSLVRGEDFPARYGGSELVLLPPNTDDSQARLPLRRLSGVINNTLFDSGNAEDPVTVQLKAGLTAFRQGLSGANLIAQARAHARAD